MYEDSATEVHASKARSRITNGARFLPSVDGRSVWARRARDLLELHISDLGGEDNVSEAQRSLCRRAAVIETELEYQEFAFAEARAAGREPKMARLDLYSRLSGNLKRLLEAVGIERRARPVPDLGEYIARQYGPRRDQTGQAGRDAPRRTRRTR